MRTTTAAIGLAFAITATLTPAAAAFEPPADPQNKFTCPGDGLPVPGHPGYPGIATGTMKSFANSGERAAAAWSATVLFNGPLAVC